MCQKQGQLFPISSCSIMHHKMQIVGYLSNVLSGNLPGHLENRGLNVQSFSIKIRPVPIMPA